MRRLLPALLVTVFFAAAGSADAAPRWLDAELPFGEAPALAGDASAAMAPDGTVVYARFAPDGALEVRERPPGGPVGPTISLARVTVAPPPQSQLEVLTGADGSAALTFNVGGIRFAAVRAAGGRWTDPSEAAPVGGQAALGPDGVLWIVAQSPALDDTLSVYRFVPGGRPQSTPLPATNARQDSGVLTVPSAGEVHVAFRESAGAPGEGERCVLRIKARTVDVFANGTTGLARTLDQVDAGGTGTADRCIVDSGTVIVSPLLLSTDAAGADTVVYTRLTIEDFTVAPFARHRDRGGAWPQIITPPERVSDADVIAEKLIGGAGAPVVVARDGAGKAIATRGADGTWTPTKTLFGFEGASSFGAARTGAGTVALAWVEGAAPKHVVGRIVDATGTLGAPTPLAPASPGDALLAVGGDAEGNAVALTSQRDAPTAPAAARRATSPAAATHPATSPAAATHPAASSAAATARRDGEPMLRAYPYDAAGPRVTSLTLPERVVAGTSALFSAAGLDVWSGPARDASWDFGDGELGGSGLTRPHAYAAGGHRTVTVRLQDDAGNETGASAELDVADAPPPPPPVRVPATPPTPAVRDVQAPRITRAFVTPRRPHSARPGLLQLTTDEAGTASVTLTKQARGVRRGKRCVAPARSRGRTCTRTLATRKVSRALGSGEQRVSLPHLSRGTWRLRVVVTDAAGNASRAQTLTVRVSV